MLSFAPARLDLGQEAGSPGLPAASRRSGLTPVNCRGVMRPRIVDAYRCLLMDLPTQAHLKTLRDLLTYRLAELRADIHAAEQERRDSAGAATRDVIDRKEEAGVRQRTEVDSAQEQRDRDELIEVEAALHRLDSGTYGDCAGCGEPIALQRLLVRPAALRCGRCQSEREHATEHARRA